MLADKHLWEEVKGTRVVGFWKKWTVLAEFADDAAKQPVEQRAKGQILDEWMKN